MGQLCQGSEDRDIKPKSDPVSLGGNTSPDVKQPRVSPQPVAEESTPGANSPPRTESASPPAGTGQTPEQPADDTTAAAESTELDEESAHQLKMEQQGREIVNMFAEVVIDVVAPAEPPVPDWQQKDIDAIQTTAQTPQILVLAMQSSCVSLTTWRGSLVTRTAISTCSSSRSSWFLPN